MLQPHQTDFAEIFMSVDVLDGAVDDTTPARKVYWAGRQWCVTDYGLETIVPDRYYIEGRSLGGVTDRSDPALPPMAERVRHVCEKTWVDVEDLFAAFAVAVDFHKVDLPKGALAEAIKHVRRKRFSGRAFDAARRAELRARGVTDAEDTGMSSDDVYRVGAVADAAVEAELARGRDFLEVRDPHLDFADTHVAEDDEED